MFPRDENVLQLFLSYRVILGRDLIHSVVSFSSYMLHSYCISGGHLRCTIPFDVVVVILLAS